MKIKIRQAKLKNIKIIDSFQNKIGIHERPLDLTIKRKGRIRYYTLENIKRLIKSKNALILIAEINGRAIGCCFGEIQKTKANWSRYGKKGYIGMIFVEDKFRRRKIGSLLIKELIKWFDKNKVKDIRLQVYENNIHTVEFYKKQGFKKYILEMVYRPN